MPPASHQAERSTTSPDPEKISGRLTIEQRISDRFRIHRYLSTGAKHGCNMVDALREAILGRPFAELRDDDGSSAAGFRSPLNRNN